MGKRFLCRTAASFVSALMGIISKPPILPNDIGIARERNGGLIVVGGEMYFLLASAYDHILSSRTMDDMLFGFSFKFFRNMLFHSRSWLFLGALFKI